MLVRVSNPKGVPIYEFDDTTKSSVFLNQSVLKTQCENGIEYESKLDKKRITFSTKDPNFHELFIRYVQQKLPNFKISVA